MTTPSTDQLRRVARALGDPSRFQIFWHIYESSEPVAVAELTNLMKFNHNAIRQHLAHLVESSLVLEEREVRDTPGRPRLLYRAREDALHAMGDASRSYGRIAKLLVQLAQTDMTPYEVGREAARSGGGAAQVGDVDAVVDLVRQLAQEGFEPVRRKSSIVLGRCPFAEVASDGPSVICEIHRGLIDGVLGREAGLKIRDPYEAGCRISL